MPRPHYETPQDRANEYALVAAFAAKHGLFIVWRNDRTGQTLLQDREGRLVVCVETRCRNHPAFKFGTLNVSLHKVEYAYKMWTDNNVPTLLLVRFVDRTMVTRLYPYPYNKPFPVVEWGRNDRGDPADVGWAAEITMGKFKQLEL